MGNEGKQKKIFWGPWAVVSVLFVAVIVLMLVRYTREGKKTATTTAQESMISYSNTWSYQVSRYVVSACEFGNIFLVQAQQTPGGIKSSSMVEFAANVVDNTNFAHVIMCENKKAVACETGYGLNTFDCSFLGEDPLETVEFYYLDDNMIDGAKSLAIVIPADNQTDCIIFLVETKTICDNLTVSGYEKVSFLVLFKKDGTICTSFSNFDDSSSEYIKDGSFLSHISDGVEIKDKYNLFKTKVYNNMPAVVVSSYNGDERTIVCTPLEVDGWYLGFGLRQEHMNSIVDNYFKDTQKVMITMGIVLCLFFIFMMIFSLTTYMRTRERGRKLAEKSDTDLLTELYNKGATERMISEYIEENPNGRGLMFILDIDNFKKVNDTMGHAFGDTLLKTLGKEIRTEFRLTDIVGRTGGDEFIIFLKDIADNLIVEREANRLTRFFRDFKAGGDYVKYSATASIGGAIYPDDASNFKDLYVAADKALYKAKKQGKNQLVFYTNDNKNTAE